MAIQMTHSYNCVRMCRTEALFISTFDGV